ALFPGQGRDMKSHSSKAPRRSFDVRRMSGPEIAAEMARHMTEFKKARRPTELVTTETWSAGTQSTFGQSQAAVHPFLRARLAAESAAALGRDSTSLSSQDDDGGHAE